MQVKRTELLQALSKVLPAVAEKALIPETDCFVLDGDYVRACDGETAISYPFKTDLSLRVRAHEFYQILSKADVEEVTLEEQKAGLSIVAGDLRVTMVISAFKHPKAKVKSQRWIPLPRNFSEAVRFCRFSAAKADDEDKVFTCLWIKDQYMISCDRLRVTRYEMESKIDTEMLLPIAAAAKLCKHSPVGFVVEGGWIYFKNAEGAVFASRLVDLEYPIEMISGLFTTQGDPVPIPEGLSRAVEESRVFLDEDDKVHITIKDGKLRCQGKNAIGKATVEFQIDYKGKDFNFPIRAEQLSDILTRAEKEMCVDEKKVYFSGANFEHLISLI